jgi:ABC-type amino acid transport substrate-binding protein
VNFCVFNPEFLNLSSQEICMKNQTMRRSRISILLAAVGSVLAIASAPAVYADTLRKISDTKRVVIGVRESDAPLSYTLGEGKYVGYHVELCEKVMWVHT